MKRFLMLFLISTAAMAQSIVIPAQTIVTPVTINGTTVKITITVPSQTVPIAGGSTGLPSGITYVNNVLTVAGSISTGTISLTSGPTLPACASGLYFLAPASSGSTTLQPSCYTVPTLSIPAITVLQAASPINTLTFNP